MQRFGDVTLILRSILFGLALAGGAAHAEFGGGAASIGDANYPDLPTPVSYESQVQSLLTYAGAKVPSDDAIKGQLGYDLLLEVLRSHPRDSIRAKAGGLLIRHPMLVPTSLETLVPLFETIPTSSAWERNHLPRAWLELRETGKAVLLSAPGRMAALLHPSVTEDPEEVIGMRDAILAQHGDLDALHRLRDALMQCIADQPEFVDCLDSGPSKGLGTLALVQERWDDASADQRAALIRWANPEPTLRAFAIAEISGTTDADLRAALIDVGSPLLDANGLQRILEESVQLAARAETDEASTRDATGLPTPCSDSVPLLDHMSLYPEHLSPGLRMGLADQMISAAIDASEPQRTCLLEMAVSYDPERERVIRAELAARRESDGSPSAEALMSLIALQSANDSLVQTVILSGGDEKWLVVTRHTPDDQWMRLADAVLSRLEDFPMAAAEYFDLMPDEMERGEAVEPSPRLKARIRAHEAAQRRMQSLAPERIPELAHRFEAQGTDAARFLAMKAWSDATENPASKLNRQRLATTLLAAQNPNLRKSGTEELAKLQGAGM